MPRSLSPESVVAINRNEWSEWTGKGGRLQPESVVAFEWNPQSSQACLPILRTSSPPRNKLQNCWKTFHEHLERNGFLQGNIS